MIHDEHVFGHNSVAQCMDGYLIVGTVGVTHLSVRSCSSDGSWTFVRVQTHHLRQFLVTFQRCRVVYIRVC